MMISGSTDAVREILASMRMVVAVNLLGLPALAVPARLDETGVPLGVQLIGSHFREDLCLGAAEAVERGVGSVAPIDPRAAG